MTKEYAMNKIPLQSLLILFCFFCSCATSNPRSYSQKNVALTTICSINSGKENDGDLVQLSGDFRTDGRHYTYVIDGKCGRLGNAIDVGRAYGNPEYDKLTKKWKQECESRRNHGLCVVDRSVSIVGIVRSTNDGLVIDIESINEIDRDGR